MSIVHYEGELGVFEYDDEMFEINEYIHYIGSSSPVIPKGVKDCSFMFEDCRTLKEAPIIPEGVKNCNGMFGRCISLKEAPVIPEGVKYCSYMFYGCTSLKEAPAPTIFDGVREYK